MSPDTVPGVCGEPASPETSDGVRREQRNRGTGELFLLVLTKNGAGQQELPPPPRLALKFAFTALISSAHTY